MKFGWGSPEELCDGIEEGSDTDARYGGLACMRIKGHEGPCVAMVRDAGMADGVCFGCRVKMGEKHLPTCESVCSSCLQKMDVHVKYCTR